MLECRLVFADTFDVRSIGYNCMCNKHTINQLTHFVEINGSKTSLLFIETCASPMFASYHHRAVFLSCEMHLIKPVDCKCGCLWS